MKSNSYTIKTANDIKSWKVMDDSITSMNFIVMSPVTKKLKEIQLDYVGSINNANIGVKIETSIDFINWFELEYLSTNSTPKYIYKAVVGDKYFNLTTKTLETLTVSAVDALEYEFSTTSEYNKDITYLYDNLEWKFIKITFSNIPSTSTVPLFLSNFQILVDDDIDIDTIDNLLEIKSPMFTRSKIFEDEEFLPDMISNFMKMIEDQKNTPDTINYASVSITNPSASASFPQGIGNDIIDLDTVVYP
jgi:hypothetical protein